MAGVIIRGEMRQVMTTMATVRVSTGGGGDGDCAGGG